MAATKFYKPPDPELYTLRKLQMAIRAFSRAVDNNKIERISFDQYLKLLDTFESKMIAYEKKQLAEKAQKSPHKAGAGEASPVGVSPGVPDSTFDSG